MIMFRSLSLVPVFVLAFLATDLFPAEAEDDSPEGESPESIFLARTVDRSRESVMKALEILDDIENLTFGEYPGGVILRGELLSPGDMRLAEKISSAFEGVINLCTLHRDALLIAADHVKEIMEKNHIRGMDLSVLGDFLLLTGTSVRDSEKSRIFKICQALNIPLVDGTREAVSDPRMVRFEVSFTEVTRDAFENIGIRWPGSTMLADPYGIRVGSLEPVQNLEIMIQHLVHQGKARIISKPRLTCGSGQEATFQAGGELPVPKTDGEGRLTITWKPYGIILHISPTLDSEGMIHTRIRSEVSMVDHASAVEGIPGILKRMVDTYLSLSPGQTIVLSGLVHSDDAERVTKVPLLGDIPVLGEIFRSKSFQTRNTELVVFLSPRTDENGRNAPNGRLDTLVPRTAP